MIIDMQNEKIYHDYHGKVFGYMCSKIGNYHLAEELTSDVFVKIYENLDTFDDTKASLSTWIYTIARNTLTDYFRTRRVLEEIPQTASDGTSVEDEICNTEMLEALANALELLDERERDIIILRFYKGKLLTEIAKQMGISYAYVKVIQSKSLEKMKNFLKK